MRGELGCLDHLIAKGAKLNAVNNRKNTALHWAARNGRAPCVASLLRAGADASLKDVGGHTALDLAKGNVGRAKEKHLAVAPGPLGSGFPPPRTHYQKEAEAKLWEHTEVVKILENAPYFAAQPRHAVSAGQHPVAAHAAARMDSCCIHIHSLYQHIYLPFLPSFLN